MDDNNRTVIGFLGCGSVGSQLYRILQARPIPDTIISSVVVAHPETISHRTSIHPSTAVSGNWSDILADPTVDVVVEAIGQPVDRSIDELAFDLCQAISSGKSLVTANKKLMAENWQAIMQASAKSMAAIGLEACVAGGIPIIEPLRARQQLTEVRTIVGILNATSNFILTYMARGASLSDARALARLYRLTEADDSADLDGSDALYKIAILASIAFQTIVPPASITLKEGILGIGPDVFNFAETFGYQLKPIAVARIDQGQLELGVYPALLRTSHPLASIHGDFNAVLVEGKYSGWHMFSGRGAGPEPTATAMYNDLVRVIRHQRTGAHEGSILMDHQWDFRARDKIERRGFFHAVLPDRPGRLAGIAKALGDKEFNIREFNRIDLFSSPATTPVMLSTDSGPMGQVAEAVKAIEELPGVRDVRYLIIEDWEDPVASVMPVTDRRFFQRR
jgi:homoserine dehydrogenase